MHSTVRPWLQYLQRPQCGRKEKITWSPGFTVVTPGPHSAISPAASWPGTIGSGEGQSPFMTCQSLWHTPEAFILTRTSPALGGSSSQSTTCRGSLGLNRTAAFIVSPPVCHSTIAPALLDPASQARSTRAKEKPAGGDDHERTQSSGGTARRRWLVGPCVWRAFRTHRHRPREALCRYDDQRLVLPNDLLRIPQELLPAVRGEDRHQGGFHHAGLPSL